jgi:hypothetical protein
MGVSLFPDHAADSSALVKLADIAMYSAKQAGKNGYCFYSAGGSPLVRVEPDPVSSDPAPSNANARAAVRPVSSPLARPMPPPPEGE